MVGVKGGHYSNGVLKISFADERRELTPGDELTFGRIADLNIDSNRHLHRRLGLFRHNDGVWWLHNTGSLITLHLYDRDSASKATLAAGAATPLAYHRGMIRFEANMTPYQILFELNDAPAASISSNTSSGELTQGRSSFGLNDEQRLMILALAEPRLNDRTALPSTIPTNRHVAHTLGWTSKKLDRKLDNLCSRLDRLGVIGLKGDQSALATSRRERVVDHCIAVGMVSAADLVLLDDHRAWLASDTAH